MGGEAGGWGGRTRGVGGLGVGGGERGGGGRERGFGGFGVGFQALCLIPLYVAKTPPTKSSGLPPDLKEDDDGEQSVELLRIRRASTSGTEG